MDWKSFLDKTKKDFTKLNQQIPDTFKGFAIMGKEAKKKEPLTRKLKNL